MTDGKKNIDEFFRDRLLDFEPTPPEDIWDDVDRRIRRKKPVVFYIRRMAVAAAFLGVILSTLWMLNRHPGSERLTQEPVSAGAAGSVAPTITPSSPAGAVGAADQEKETAATLTIPATETPAVAPAGTVARNMTVAEMEYKEETSRIRFAYLENRQALIRNEIHPSLMVPEEPVTETIIAMEPVFEERSLKWSITGQFSPIYSDRFLTSEYGSSSYMVNYYDRIEGGLLSYSGGVSVNLQPMKRFTVSTGLYYSTMGQNIRGVTELTVSSLGFETNSLLAMIEEKFYLVYNSTGVIESANKYVNIVQKPTEVSTFTGSRDNRFTWKDLEPSDAKVIQTFEFLELPVVMRYRFIDRKVECNLVGGVSTNFLVGNRSTFFLEKDEFTTVTTQSLNRVNYSGIIGLGFDYELFPNLLLNLEPTFKYYLNSFSNKNLIGSHPYAVGLFSGLRFIF